MVVPCSRLRLNETVQECGAHFQGERNLCRGRFWGDFRLPVHPESSVAADDGGLCSIRRHHAHSEADTFIPMQSYVQPAKQVRSLVSSESSLKVNHLSGPLILQPFIHVASNRITLSPKQIHAESCGTRNKQCFFFSRNIG